MMSAPARLVRALLNAAILVLPIFSPPAVSASPITVGGFTFDAGEAAFADDAFLVSGSGVRFTCAAGVSPASSFAKRADKGRYVKSGAGERSPVAGASQIARSFPLLISAASHQLAPVP